MNTCDEDYEYSLCKKKALVVDNGVDESLQDKLEFKECDFFFKLIVIANLLVLTCELFSEPQVSVENVALALL